MIAEKKWTIAVGCDNNGWQYKDAIMKDFESDPRVERVIGKYFLRCQILSEFAVPSRVPVSGSLFTINSNSSTF